MTMSWKVCCLGIALLSLVSQNGSRAVTITITNSCEYTIWPVIFTTSTGPTGFELGGDGEKRSIQVRSDWRGRVWGRTLCSFDTAGNGKCATGDCGTGLECTNFGTPPVTLAEFGLNGVGHTDFYDVSLVDGFNVPMVVQAVGGRGSCRTTGCPEDLNRICPKDLQVAGNVACKSGCDAFGKPEYCCTGDFVMRPACKPSKYSLFYKAACPRTYTYALDDDATSNCSDADYFVTFCPSPASHSPFTRPTRSGVASPPPPPPPSTPRNSTPSVSQNGSRAVTITITNSCEYTIWPVILATSAGPTGFKLGGDGEKRSIQVPKDWRGRVWGRTLCSFDTAGNGKCATGDCGTGLECTNYGTPPATLAEFGLNGVGHTDFYDVSLVDGFNVPMVVQAVGGSGSCRPTGCLQDLNKICPKDLQVAGNFACKSGCVAFGKPEYCCFGDFDSRSTCKPSKYSRFYKAACPRTYTYAYDDDLATFNCSNADYFITFCPSPASHSPFTRPATPSPPPPPPSTHHNSTSGHLAPNTTTPSFTSSLPLPSFLALSHVLIQVILFLRL